MRLIRTLLVLLLVAVAPPVFAQVSAGLSITVAPPPLPVYAQPVIPAPGYIWTPGYWAWGPAGYYWVPGTWVLPPAIGLLWTPGYWAWVDGAYGWHAGHWGRHVGFYGGIDYGFGYGGTGYDGGYWRNNTFFYNRSVNNVRNARVTNVYARSVPNSTTPNRASFNGGTGGAARGPTRQETAVQREAARPPTAPQTRHEHVASTTPALQAATNHGNPPFGATRRPGVMPRTAAAPAAQPARQQQPRPSARAPEPPRGEQPRGGDDRR